MREILEMDREFRSEVGWGYRLVMALVTFGCVCAFLQTNVWVIICMALVTMLVIHVFLNTWYRVTEDSVLIAHCSIFPEKKIAISDIGTLEPSVMPVSSYALSMNRILIYTTDGKPWMMVSPKNRTEFVKLLRSINPQIEIKKENSII